jgi:hypothetical protein
VPAPTVEVARQGSDLRVERSFDALPASPQRRPVRLLVTATRVGRGVFPVDDRQSAHLVSLPRGTGPVEVQVTALARSGAASDVVRRRAPGP